MLKDISNFYILKTNTDQFYPRNIMTITLMSGFYKFLLQLVAFYGEF